MCQLANHRVTRSNTYQPKARCHGQWELRGEAGAAAIIAVVGCSLSRGFYCLASGASVAGLVPGVEQTPGSVSIV